MTQSKRTTLRIVSAREEVTSRGASGMAIGRVFTPQIVELTFSEADYHPINPHGSLPPFDTHEEFRAWCAQTDNAYGWRGKVIAEGPRGNDDGLWRFNAEQIAWCRKAIRRYHPVNEGVFETVLKEYEGPVRLVGPVIAI